MPYQDRFANEKYLNQEPIGIGLGTQVKDELYPMYMPEGIFNRLVFLGKAYELHLIGNLDFYSTTRLNSTQCSILNQELDFIDGVVEDALLERYLIQLKEMSVACSRRMHETLVFDGP